MRIIPLVMVVDGRPCVVTKEDDDAICLLWFSYWKPHHLAGLAFMKLMPKQAKQRYWWLTNEDEFESTDELSWENDGYDDLPPAPAADS